MSRIVLTTRASALALAQARQLAGALGTAHAALEVELLPLSTRGDELLDRSLAALGGKGLFVKALELALLDGRARLAAHSVKDVPAALDGEFALAAIPARADPRDVIIARRQCDELRALPRRARVGTSSLRRRSQMLALRSDLEVVSLRGGIERRLARLDAGELDAIVLAAAGLERLGIGRGSKIDLDTMLPAAGQGALALEALAGDDEAIGLARAIEDSATRYAVSAERAFCRALEASCTAPVAAYARATEGRILLRVRVASPDGSTLLSGSREGRPEEAVAIGRDLAEELLGRGAGELIGGHGAQA